MHGMIIAKKREILKDLVFSFLKKDIHESSIRDEYKFYQLIRILASQAGQLVNANELGNTIGVLQDTIKRYLYVLRKSCIIRLHSPFHRNIHKELTKMPKIYFLDGGLRNCLQNRYPDIVVQTMDRQVLENQVVIDLARGGVDNLKFWRTQDKHEIDLVIDDSAAYEVKNNIKQFNSSKYRAFERA